MELNASRNILLVRAVDGSVFDPPAWIELAETEYLELQGEGVFGPDEMRFLAIHLYAAKNILGSTGGQLDNDGNVLFSDELPK